MSSDHAGSARTTADEHSTPAEAPATEARSRPSASPDPSAAGSRSRFYTTSSSRPFSRSALQRQSVHTLPSIKHLQHGFAKMGILAERNQVDAAAQGTGGLAARRKSSGALQPLVTMSEARGGGEDVLDELGPQPDKPEVDLRMPWEREQTQTGRTLKDAKQLRAETVEAIDAVCDCWSIQPDPSRPRSSRRSSSFAVTGTASSASDAPPLSPLDSPTTDLPLIPTLLATTTLAVRAIQALAVSLPSLSPTGPPPPSPRKPNPLDVSTAARPRTSLALPFSVSSAPAPWTAGGKGKERAGGVAGEGEDPLLGLRRTSLDVLGMLREVEARYRLPAVASSSSGLLALPLGDEVTVVDSPLDLNAPPPRPPAPAPSASLAAPAPPAHAPPQYRTDVDLSSLASEAELVERWVRAVEPILAHVPLALRDGLPDPAVDREGFLNFLSDGTLLCRSYNALLRSPLARPFGFLPSSSIHVFPSSAAAGPESAGMARTLSAASTGSESGERVGGTFRRAENLGQWAAALKHRYALPLPSFDARAIAARRPEGDWRAMLADAVAAWADAVAREAREVWREQGGGAEGPA
ncbi:hypothetical protein JCM10450v2_002803 [Rhodotorula kratochvilovae]